MTLSFLKIIEQGLSVPLIETTPKARLKVHSKFLSEQSFSFELKGQNLSILKRSESLFFNKMQLGQMALFEFKHELQDESNSGIFRYFYF